ncbi:MAG: YkgJ family cysteine cluster protein [Desulfobacterales bacterium]|jgi:Fe-S-cluster containining protein
MERRKKQSILEAIYRIEETFSRGVEPVCKPGCASCCTARVTMTTLEGAFIASYLARLGENRLLEQIRRSRDPNRFFPKITTNRLAEICLRGEEAPAEEMAETLGTCPLLEADRCAIYPVRPLACRTMVSRIDCAASGFADMDDFSVTVSTVLMQYVEHIDADGCSGNFADVLLCLSSPANRTFYRQGALSCPENGLIKNRPIPALMIPPEHRERIRPLLETISKIRL